MNIKLFSVVILSIIYISGAVEQQNAVVGPSSANNDMDGESVLTAEAVSGESDVAAVENAEKVERAPPVVETEPEAVESAPRAAYDDAHQGENLKEAALVQEATLKLINAEKSAADASADEHKSQEEVIDAPAEELQQNQLRYLSSQTYIFNEFLIFSF